jgi:DNA-binding MurR/RpiR family transcriptional regulator
MTSTPAPDARVSAGGAIASRIFDAASTLTPSERRVAEALLDDPKIVAFGTVAQLARRAGCAPPTVLRFAGKVGFHGFVDLQAAVQEEIADQLRPATQRIRERHPYDVLATAFAADLENVRRTMEGVDAAEFHATVELLADRRHRVFVLASEISGPAGAVLAHQLDLLRDGVRSIRGSSVQVSRELVRIDADDVVVAIDVRRYEHWLLDTLARAHDRGARVVAITDTRLSPVATRAKHAFVISARGVGPFDSAVGALALVHALGAAVARRLRRSATGRLDAVEAAWHVGEDLTDA